MDFTGRAAFSFADVLYEKKDGVARVTLNRAETYNAYTSDTLSELLEAFRDASIDDSIGVVVLTGAGDKAFCSGADAREFSQEFLRRPRNLWKFNSLLMEAIHLFRHLGKPTIARVNGIVAGGGNDWCLAADLAIAADHARFVQMGTRVGLVDAMGASQWLPLMMGDRRAREMLLTCDEITSDQALSWGLVNQVVTSKQLDRAVNAMAKKLLQKFPESTRYTLQQLNFWKDFVWSVTAGHASEWQSTHASSWEAYEGVQSFLEKRPPDTRTLRERAAQGKSSEFLWGANARRCPDCGAKGIPERFDYCGKCGAKLKA